MLRLVMETTAEEYAGGYPPTVREEHNCEIINGELHLAPVPGTRHQEVSMRLAAVLYHELETRNIGTVLGSPCNVMLSPWDILRPDLLFVRRNRRGIIGDHMILGAPDLVVEILSDASRLRDLREKKRIYAESGVPEYWILDPEGETIEARIWSELGYISAGVVHKRQTFLSPMLPGLNLPLATIFESEPGSGEDPFVHTPSRRLSVPGIPDTSRIFNI